MVMRGDPQGYDDGFKGLGLWIKIILSVDQNSYKCGSVWVVQIVAKK